MNYGKKSTQNREKELISKKYHDSQKILRDFL